MKIWLNMFFILGFFVSNVSLLPAKEAFIEKDPVEMVTIPAGPFIHGSTDSEGRPDERPRRKIFLHAYTLDKYEVTNRQYQKFIEETLHKPPLNVYNDEKDFDISGVEELPVVQVTWHDAVDYCFWAGKRLPTEAEWEKAARGTDGRIYPWGDSTHDTVPANFDGEWRGVETLMNATSLPEGASPYGIHHMAGNVREWVEDWYTPDYYKNSPERNPRGPDSGILKVIRGGSWRSFLPDLRVMSRGKGGFALKTHGIGFRCARDASLSKHAKDPAANVRGKTD
ncbi:formylglycine-generating enzyme family protein [Nitrospira sp. M1]